MPRSRVVAVGALAAAVVVGVVLLQIVDQDAHQSRVHPQSRVTSGG
jgi:Flp pilus assembly protein CpaB